MEKDFRISLYLHNFFTDYRSMTRIYIDSSITTIGDLKNHIKHCFKLKHFHLMSQNHWLPTMEDVRILQEGDIVVAIPKGNRVPSNFDENFVSNVNEDAAIPDLENYAEKLKRQKTTAKAIKKQKEKLSNQVENMKECTLNDSETPDLCNTQEPNCQVDLNKFEPNEEKMHKITANLNKVKKKYKEKSISIGPAKIRLLKNNIIKNIIVNDTISASRNNLTKTNSQSALSINDLELLAKNVIVEKFSMNDSNTTVENNQCEPHPSQHGINNESSDVDANISVMECSIEDNVNNLPEHNVVEASENFEHSNKNSEDPIDFKSQISPPKIGSFSSDWSTSSIVSSQQDENQVDFIVQSGYIRKRKRVRKNKKKTILVSGPEIIKTAEKPKSLTSLDVKPKIHIKFDDEGTVVKITDHNSLEDLPLEKSKLNVEISNEIEETAVDHVVVDVNIESKNVISVNGSSENTNIELINNENVEQEILDTKETANTINGDEDLSQDNINNVDTVMCNISVEDIEKCPLMDQLKPKENDIVAFKIMKKTDAYLPIQSNDIVVRIENFDESDGNVLVTVLKGREEFDEPCGIFTIENKSAEENRNIGSKKLKWSELITPRLIFP